MMESKLREALEKIAAPVNDSSIFTFSGYASTFRAYQKIAREALAELEKPVDGDVHNHIARIISFVDKLKTPLIRSSASDLYDLLEVELQQFAETYHAKLCRECKALSEEREA